MIHKLFIIKNMLESDLNEKLLEKDGNDNIRATNLDMSKILNNEYNTSVHASE